MKDSLEYTTSLENKVLDLESTMASMVSLMEKLCTKIATNQASINNAAKRPMTSGTYSKYHINNVEEGGSLEQQSVTFQSQERGDDGNKSPTSNKNIKITTLKGALVGGARNTDIASSPHYHFKRDSLVTFNISTVSPNQRQS